MKLDVPGQGTFQIVIDKTGIKPTVCFKQSKAGGEHKVSYQDAIGQMKYGGVLDDIELFEKALLKSKEICEQASSKDHDILIFLKESIFILNETKRRFIGSPDLVQDLTYLYWTIFQKIRNEVKPVDVIDVCERCLDFLENDANQDWFDRMVLDKGPRTTTREEAVIEVVNELLSQLKKYRGKLKNKDLTNDAKKETERGKKRVEQALSRAKDKLMTWYNLKKGGEITTALQDGKIPSSLRRFISGWLPEIIGVLTLAYSVYFENSSSFRDIFRGFKPLDLDCGIWILFIYFLLTCGIFVAAAELLRKTKWVDTQIYLPRMAAGIIVGYLVLLSDEAWGGIFGDHEWLFVVGRILLPCVAVFIYILIEMNNVKGIRYPIFGKAFRLLSRGAAYAVLTGVIVSDLFGEAIVKRIPETAKIFKTSSGLNPAHLNGLFGNIYPEVIFYIAPLALFIGVFVQLLWEDKTLTAKI